MEVKDRLGIGRLISGGGDTARSGLAGTGGPVFTGGERFPLGRYSNHRDDSVSLQRSATPRSMSRHHRHRRDKQKTILSGLSWSALAIAAASIVLSLVAQRPTVGLICGSLAVVLGSITVGVTTLEKRSRVLAGVALAASILAVVIGIVLNRPTEQRITRVPVDSYLSEEVPEVDDDSTEHVPLFIDDDVAASSPGITDAGDDSSGSDDDPDRPLDPIEVLYADAAVDLPDDPDSVRDLEKNQVVLKTVDVPAQPHPRTCVVEAAFYKRVTDEEFEQLGPSLSRLPNLRAIIVNDGRISEIGLNAVQEMPQIQKFVLPQATDRIARRLARFVGLREISFIRRGSLTDEGLVHLAELQRLERLDLGTAEQQSTAIGEPGFAALGRIQGLRSLAVRQIPVTPDRLNTLKTLNSLAELDLGRTGVNGAGLASLPQFASLRRLNLQAAQLADDALAPLADCLKLERLNLADLENFDGEQLRHLVELPELRQLVLSRTRLDDDALPHLLKMRQLVRLDVSDCGLNGPAINRLRDNLDECEVLAAGVPRDSLRGVSRLLAVRKPPLPAAAE